MSAGHRGRRPRGRRRAGTGARDRRPQDRRCVDHAARAPRDHRDAVDRHGREGRRDAHPGGCRMTAGITTMSAGALAEAIRTRALSSQEVVEAHLARIDEVNPAVNAIVSYAPEAAIETAKECDRELARGRLR